jgi:uncharacterized RDD family membrane protein YckC
MSYQGYPQGGYGAPPSGYGAPPAGYGTPPQFAYASMGKRFAAAILDGLIVFIGTVPGWILFVIAMVGAASSADSSGRLSNDAAGAFVGMMFLGYALIFIGVLIVWLYNVYLLGRDGASLGKRWMKIKVLDPNGQPLGFGKAFLRELVKAVLGNLCFLLYLWPLFDDQKQGLHDKLFGTHVYEA